MNQPLRSDAAAASAISVAVQRALHAGDGFVEALPIGLYSCNRDGVLVHYNRRAAELWGWAPPLGDPQFGCGMHKAFHPNGRPVTPDQSAMREVLRTRKPVRNREIILERPDGSRITILANLDPLFDPDGALIGGMNCFQDISELKAAEHERLRLDAELRRLNETLEQRVEERSRALVAEIEERRLVEAQLHQLQKTEAIGQLTGGIAHDFNNLLTAVMGNLDCILARSPATEIRKHADAAQRAARRGANLTQQLLAFSRRQRLELKPTSINGLVSGMREMLLPALGGTIRIQLVLARGLWPSLIDANQIESAILNLVINARDAMSKGGTVTIETANLSVGPAKHVAGITPGDYVVIAVTDTGAGMTEAVKEKAFDPFFTTKDVGKGSGLGLSQVYGVARQSGGAADIDSTVGGGTTVRIYLPRVREAMRAPWQEDAPGTPPVARRAECVLVVDDDKDVRGAVVACLRALGYDVAAVDSGAAAMAALEKVQFDLVIMDFAMPEMSGAEASQLIAARWPGLPTLYITGYGESRALGTGTADRFILRKPFASADLDAKIRDILERAAAPMGANVVKLRTQSG